MISLFMESIVKGNADQWECKTIHQLKEPVGKKVVHKTPTNELGSL